MNDIFLNPVGRLRSGWRVAIFVGIFVVLFIVVNLFAFVITQIITQDAKASFLFTRPGFVITSFVSLVLATLVGWFCGKVLEGLPLKALGWVFNRTFLKDFLLGLLVGGLSLTIAVLLAMPTGGISLTRNETSDFSSMMLTIAGSFVIFSFAAAFEEVLFRGYILQTLFRSHQIWPGILLTSIFFASVHNNNPNANYFSFVNTFIAGIWFAVAYLKTRSLWLAFGLHLAWNWFQGAFYGINVSGLSQIAPDPLWRAVDTGPVWLTGGHYGIEGGLVCTIALIISTALIWFLPIFKPTAEMLALTSEENPKGEVMVNG